MSNREYYGDNVPEQTGSLGGLQQPNSRQWSDASQAQNNTHLYQGLDHQQFQGGPADGTSPGEMGGAEGEKGLGSTILGGAGGAFVGHQVGKQSGHGVLGTVGGGLVGAVLANMAEKAVKGSHSGHRSTMRDRRRERLERKLDRLS